MGMPRATHATRVSRSEERGESAWTAKAGIEGPFDFVKLGLHRATWMTRRNRISTSVFHGFEKNVEIVSSLRPTQLLCSMLVGVFF